MAIFQVAWQDWHTNPGHQLLASAGELARLLERAGVTSGDAGGFVRELSDDELLALVAAAHSVSADARLIEIALAGEVAQRSQRGDEQSLAKRHGQKSGAELVAVTTGDSVNAAKELIALGVATAALVDEAGGPVPPVHPPVAEALDDGMPAVIGNAILATLRKVEGRVDGQRLLARRAGWVTQQNDGMTRFSFLLDPESAGYLPTAINAKTARRRDMLDSEVDADMTDHRTHDQRLADNGPTPPVPARRAAA